MGTCANCHSSDPNLVGIAAGKECRDPFHCAAPESHGNPFRYCPYCNWTESTTLRAAPQGPSVPLTREQQLERSLRDIRTLAEAWVDPSGDQIIALIDQVLIT